MFPNKSFVWIIALLITRWTVLQQGKETREVVGERSESLQGQKGNHRFVVHVRKNLHSRNYQRLTSYRGITKLGEEVHNKFRNWSILLFLKFGDGGVGGNKLKCLVENWKIGNWTTPSNIIRGRKVNAFCNILNSLFNILNSVCTALTRNAL